MCSAVRLTTLAQRAGCAAKFPPGALLPLIARIPGFADPNVIVGNATADDAAVYRLDDDNALVLTTDFFTPIVDDPFTFGAIAAANALSDVYAMGGRPLAALNIAGFPDGLEEGVLAEILRGGASMAESAGIPIVGGHTIRAPEPIYGLAVTGLVHPAKIVTNAGARPGDRLVLTKSLGVGIITTAAKRGQDALGLLDGAIELMTTLNRAAGEAMTACDAHAATDITGFGLLGHLLNVVRASRCSARIWSDAVPCIRGVRAYVGEDLVPGGTRANLSYVRPSCKFSSEVDPITQVLLCDAQTSGGLLIAIAADNVEKLIALLEQNGVPGAAEVGVIEAGPEGSIEVAPKRT